MELHIKIEITGKVQGVWFRKSAKDQADLLGVYGYVENCENGSVYMEVEGSVEDLENFIKWCHDGPPLAKVKEVVVLKYPQLKYFGSFEIRNPGWL